MVARLRCWKDVREEARATGRLDKARIAALHREMLGELRAHRLAKIRESAGLNQTDLASRPGISQSRVSRIERRNLDGTELATVRAYIGALGGEVENIAKLGDERITIG